MKSSRLLSLSLLVIALVCTASNVKAATVLYSQDFSSSSVVATGNPYLGGWFTPQTAFQAWNGTPETSITAGALTVAPTNSIRSAGVVLSPQLFPQAGTYTLSFDVAAYSGSTNNNGLVTIWAGSGYDLTRTTGNALIVDTINAELKTSGSATASLLASQSFTSAGDGQSITFDYDGSSAVALFFGAATSGWPFPTITYDNITLTKSFLTPVPEPSVTVLLSLVVTAGCLRRRRAAH